MEVIDALEQARRQHGLPTTIRVDHGSQFTSKELDLWTYANDVLRGRWIKDNGVLSPIAL